MKMFKRTRRATVAIATIAIMISSVAAFAMFSQINPATSFTKQSALTAVCSPTIASPTADNGTTGNFMGFTVSYSCGAPLSGFAAGTGTILINGVAYYDNIGGTAAANIPESVLTVNVAGSYTPTFTLPTVTSSTGAAFSNEQLWFVWQSYTNCGPDTQLLASGTAFTFIPPCTPGSAVGTFEYNYVVYGRFSAFPGTVSVASFNVVWT
jgi:hypothetical protein